MLLSVYTYVKNGLYQDYHVLEMLKHHLPLADEILVNEGYSSDGTYEQITTIDPKIRVFRTVWPDPKDSFDWYIPLKDSPRRECKGEWCLHLDADEFIPEWEFEQLRRYISTASEDLISIQFLNFYGNYKVNVQPSHALMKYKVILHRNRPDIEFWGDGANVRIRGKKIDLSSLPTRFACHHFGEVRHPARLRNKWHLQGQMYKGIRRWFQYPAFLFNLFPHDWKDPQFLDKLEIYEGPYTKAVRDNPQEFVRDGFQLYEYLKARQALQRA